jgi:hypothetical protein
MDRRQFLQGSGVLLTLPTLESFAAPKAVKPQPKLIYLGTLFGITRDAWFPKETGLSYKTTDLLKPLESHKKDFTILSNMCNPKAIGTHSSSTTLYTSANLAGTPGKGFQNSISCDQVAAQYLGKDSRYNSIELTGHHDDSKGAGPGFSLAWDRQGKPLPGIPDPLEFFNYVFGDGGMSVAERKYLLKRRKSILDSVHGEAKRVQKIVSKADGAKLDEYFQSVRQLEVRLGKAQKWAEVQKPKAPMGKPDSRLMGKTAITMMYDIMVAALQTNSTRVISYRQPLQSLLKEIGCSNSSHLVSHHENRAEEGAYQDSVAKDKAQSTLLSHLFDKLKAVKESDGSTLFDNTIISFSSGVSHGHSLRKVPTIIAGGSRCGLKHQGHIEIADGKNELRRLWLTTLKSAKVPVDEFCGSKEIVPEVLG